MFAYVDLDESVDWEICWRHSFNVMVLHRVRNFYSARPMKPAVEMSIVNGKVLWNQSPICWYFRRSLKALYTRGKVEQHCLNPNLTPLCVVPARIARRHFIVSFISVTRTKQFVDAISFSTCYSNAIILWKISADTLRWRQIYLHMWWSYPNKGRRRRSSVMSGRESDGADTWSQRWWLRSRSSPGMLLWKNDDDYNRFVFICVLDEFNCYMEGHRIASSESHTQMQPTNI